MISSKNNILHFFIATIWLINGLVCKVLNIVPRHQEIVARILGEEHARLLTVLIGLSEIAMAIWIITGIRKRIGAIIQILAIATMNALEFIMVPDLLLWGRVNAFFALVFIALIYYNEFHFKKQPALQA